MHKRVELIANGAIIVVSSLVCIAFVKTYLLPERGRVVFHDRKIALGAKASLPDVDWGRGKQTLLLVLQRECRFCSESAPFYRRLLREATGRKNIQFIFVLPNEVKESREYLSEIEVPIEDVRQADLKSLDVAGTPTLILVNNEGVITNAWRGKLSPEKESEVLKKLDICDACGN